MKNACPICGSTEPYRLKAHKNFDLKELDCYGFASRKMPEYMHYELRECIDCGVLYAVDQMDSEQLSGLYREAEFDSAEEAGYASRTYVRYLKKFYGDLRGNVSLDIGTGEGSFLAILKNEEGAEVWGVEPSVAPIGLADPSIKNRIVNDRFRPGLFEADLKFSIITCFQTMEHIPEPQELIRNINDILVDGGVYYTVCHDYTAFVNRMLGKKSPIYDIEHLQLFSAKSLYKLMISNGFSDIITFKITNRYPLSYWMKLFPLPKGIKKTLMTALAKIGAEKIMISVNVGNVGVIARKKTK